MIYDGFISYSHAADGLLAPRLQAGLQRFAKPWWQRRALRIFRDESSLSASPHLWSSITEALDESDWFVLLLSPDAAASEWVNQEVAYWVEHRDPDRIIPVVTAGEFGWDGSDVTGDAVPDALRGAMTEEPRWVDARRLGDPESLDLKNPQFAAVVADLAAPLRGIPKDELASEEARQHKRTVRTAWAAGAVVVGLAVAASLAALFALGQRDEAERQTGIAREALAEAEAQTARADRTAQRLIDFVVRPQDPAGAAEPIVPPENPNVRQLPPSELDVMPAPPTSFRLDFQQERCIGETCFTVPAFVRDQPPSRTIYSLDTGVGTAWLAHEPFHIRHGFAGVEDLDGRIDFGYSVDLFVTRTDGPPDNTYARDVAYRVNAAAAVDVDDPSCGPELPGVTASAGCTESVFDFPDGLPPGVYELVVEWVAPCSAWFEIDICGSPARPISIHYVGGLVAFFTEDWRRAHIALGFGGDLPWPFDPWSRSEPLP